MRTRFSLSPKLNLVVRIVLRKIILATMFSFSKLNLAVGVFFPAEN